jgi:hypothetical protein
MILILEFLGQFNGVNLMASVPWLACRNFLKNMLKSLYLFTILSLSVSAQSVKTPVTNADFIDLEVKIKEFIAGKPDRRIPLLVRNVFHDLFLQKKAGYHGCIMKSDFVENLENGGLAGINENLSSLISTNFADKAFSLGDVIAFSGKVAVEAAYPCLNIDFKFNRSPCVEDEPVISNEAPSAFIDSIEGLEGMFKYLGNDITAEDMAILFAGAHGIKGARAGPSGWFGVFATVTSGKNFIAKTFSSIWKGTSERTLFQFFTGDTFNRESSIIRLPSDMIFYPSKVPKGSRKDDSAQATNIENVLRGFLNQDRTVFDKRFEQAFTKMLRIGNGDQTFVSNKTSQCPTTPTTTRTSTSGSTLTLSSTSFSSTMETTDLSSTSFVRPTDTTVAPPTNTVAPPTTTVATLHTVSSTMETTDGSSTDTVSFIGPSEGPGYPIGPPPPPPPTTTFYVDPEKDLIATITSSSMPLFPALKMIMAFILLI